VRNSAKWNKDEAKKVSDCHESRNIRNRSLKYAKLLPDHPSGSDILKSQSRSGKFSANILRNFRSTCEWAEEKHSSIPWFLPEIWGVLTICRHVKYWKYRLHKETESYPETDAEFSAHRLSSFLVNTKKSNASRCSANVACQQSVSNVSKCRCCTERIYLCNFRTNVTGERTSSALKRVKDELSTTNSTMAQSRMTALSLLCIQCIENDIVERLQFDVVIDKMPNRQQEECQLFSNKMHSLP